MRVVTLLLAAGCVAACGAWAQAPDLRTLDVVERSVPIGPVAMFDNGSVDGAEFIREYRRHLAEVVQMVRPPELTDEFRVRAGLMVLGEMIRREILAKEAERRGLSVSAREIDAEYAERLKTFEAELTAATGRTPTETEILARAGQTREEAKASIHRRLLAQQARDAIAAEKGVTVTDQEISEYYSDNPQLFQRPGRMHLNQIFIIPKPNAVQADEAAWTRAEELTARARARILAGEQFAAVARDMSEAPDASQGGDLGMLAVAEMPPFFVEVAAMMKPGELSQAFRSQYGVHLLRLAAAEPSETVTEAEAEPAIRRMLTHLKSEEAVAAFCEPIINDPDRTKIFIQLERTLAAMGKTAGD